MFQQLLVIIISYGLLRSMIYGQCVGANCGRSSIGVRRHHLLTSSRFSPVNYRNHHHYHITTFSTGCGADKNAVGDNCCNCCCNEISPSSPCINDNDNHSGGATVIATGCEPSSTDCNSKGVTDPNISQEEDEYPTNVPSSLGKKPFKIESNCPPSRSCPLSPPCPTISNSQRFNQNSDTQTFKKNLTLPILPKGVPIIPSPQLDMLTNGGNIGFSNIHDLHLPTIQPPSIGKPRILEPFVDNFPSHDCCTRCSSENCILRNTNNAVILAARTFKNRRNYETKCKSKELRKLMLAPVEHTEQVPSFHMGIVILDENFTVTN
uniref:Uncharacterized protein n=1 Tax=Loa loa TaxID=7209 RepID=A0A1I7W4C9_LOALO